MIDLSATFGFSDWEPPGHFDEERSVWFTDRDVINTFPDAGIDIFSAVDGNSFWFHHRNEVIAQMVEKYGDDSAFVEVGSGSGVVAADLSRRGHSVLAVEPIAEGAINGAGRGVTLSVCGDLASLELPTSSVHQIGMFDVLEHIEKSDELLAECARVLGPDGLLYVTVPAHQWLWSDFDEWNGHFRRYNRKLLRSELEAAGFTTVFSSYFFFPLLVPAAISRLVMRRVKRERTKEEIEQALADDLAPSSGLVASLLGVIHRVEARLLGKIPIVTGTSILCVARVRT